jgi:diamine N-acetyltransferase
VEVSIRDVIPDELSAVYALNMEFAQLYDAVDKFTLSKEEFIADQNCYRCRVAIVNKKIVGFSTTFLAYYTWVGKALYLDDLFVTQDCRNHGVGAKLFEDAIQLAKNENCKRLVWQVSAWNEKAQQFYKGYGAHIYAGVLNSFLDIDFSSK